MKCSFFLLVFAILTLPLDGADEQSVTVKTIWVENSAVMVIADWKGKPTQLTCQISLPSCSQPQLGEYSMRPATADEGIYNDCTNVVLLKSSGAAKEKIGVYCCANGSDCYMVRCSTQRVETIRAVVATNTLTEVAQGSESPLPHAICIEHVGESDKFILGIAIADSSAGIQLCRSDSTERVGLPDIWVHVLDSALTMRLIEIADATSNDADEHPHAFGTLAVVTTSTDNKHVQVLIL